MAKKIPFDQTVQGYMIGMMPNQTPLDISCANSITYEIGEVLSVRFLKDGRVTKLLRELLLFAAYL